jgi:acetyl esterase/lipase
VKLIFPIRGVEDNLQGMRTYRCIVVAVLCLIIFPMAARGGDELLTVDVWPGKAPGETGSVGEEKILPSTDHIQRITNVTKPTLTIYRPDKDKDTGASVVICPGGGYSILAWDLEGIEVAQWLNRNGVTGIILKYRVPKRKELAQHLPPLQDAQRAMSLVRSKAKEWGLDPKRIGMLGFSAGGNLTALACTRFEERSYEVIDQIDKVSCRPDFGVLLYPAWLVQKGKDELDPLVTVTAQTPPMFLAHADDDKLTAANSAVMYLALKKAGVPAELHVYRFGGHGFGLRPTTRPASTWPDRCAEWMRDQKLLAPVTP